METRRQDKDILSHQFRGERDWEKETVREREREGGRDWEKETERESVRKKQGERSIKLTA